MKKIIISLGIVIFGLIALALEVSLIGLIYELVKSFWHNATAYIAPQWSDMMIGCFALLFISAFAIAIPAGAWYSRIFIKKFWNK